MVLYVKLKQINSPDEQWKQIHITGFLLAETSANVNTLNPNDPVHTSINKIALLYL